MSVCKSHFGTTSEGKGVDLYTIKNAAGFSAGILTYGASLNTLTVPGKDGAFKDIVLGFDTMEDNERFSAYQGMIAGRYANRIAGASFTLNGKVYNLTANEKGKTSLHSAGELAHAVWGAAEAGGNAVRLRVESPDGTHGFPGTLTAEVLYTLTDGGELIIDYYAVSDKDTVINITNHAYFNLGGFDAGSVLNHTLQINAERFTVTDADSIPTGELRPVKGTAFDFTAAKPIGLDISADDEQLKNCLGYDHNFCLNEKNTGEPAASAYEPATGILMEVFTDMPGVQLYTGNFLNGAPGKAGTKMTKHKGFCLETQFYPDTPNRPEFPPCFFAAGEVFRSRTSLRFSVV